METAKLIAEVVEKQGISEYRLAKELGVNPSAVSHWKRGKSHPNGPHLMELLRRAGRLAAGIVLGVAVGSVAAPEPVQADQGASVETVSLLHIIRKTWGQIRLWFALRGNRNAAATTLAF